jgi:hypothetical protein
MREWDERGGRPSFGHRAYWIEDVLDALDASEIAAYALAEGPDDGNEDEAEHEDDATRPRRYLVACELGLLDARASVDDRGNPVLASALVPWPEVRGARLTALTALDDAYRHATRWTGSLAWPVVRIEQPTESDALLELWRECLVRTQVPPPVEAGAGE